MNLDDLIERYGVLLAWGLLVFVVVLLITGIVAPLSGAYIERKEKIESDYAMLSRLDSIAKLRPDQIRKQAEEVDAVLGDFAFTDAGGEDRLRLSLRKKMESLAQEYSVRLQSIETVRTSREDDIQSVVLKINAEAEPEGAIKLLESLRTDTPLLVVDEVLLYRGSSQRRRRGKKEQSEALADPLNLSFKLEAFLVPQG